MKENLEFTKISDLEFLKEAFNGTSGILSLAIALLIF